MDGPSHSERPAGPGRTLSRPLRIGIVGFGFIGRGIAERIQASNGALELAFVYNRSQDRLTDLASELRLTDLGDFTARSPDLVVEIAHPSITTRYGSRFLAVCDYLPVSTTALIDNACYSELIEAARNAGTRILLPAGALVGGEALLARKSRWRSVRITFRKHPNNIDFSDAGIDPASIRESTIVYEGPVRGVAELFSRNVNTMVTCALMSTGLDQCTGVLIADPSLDCAIAEVEAWGDDGGYLKTEKRQPAVGVSGTEMIDSVWHSIEIACGIRRQPTQLV